MEAPWDRALNTCSVSVSVFIPRTVGRKPLEDFETSDLITYVIVKVPDQLLVPLPRPQEILGSAGKVVVREREA